MLRLSNRLRAWLLIGCCAYILATEAINVNPVLAQNVVQRIWRRFTRRADSEGRPATVGKGGANRDRCPYTEQELTAIVPVSEATGFPYLEQTLSERPTWYFYVPYPPRLGHQVEFVLIDEVEKILYQEKFPIEGTPGILSVTLPKNIPGLAVNQSYRWVFSVICTPSNRSGDATVNGWIQRIAEDDLSSELALADERERYSYYIDNLLWFEAIDELVRLQGQYPNEPQLRAAWNELAELVAIDDLPRSVFPLHAK